MTRLELLKKEAEQIQNMRCLSFDLKDQALFHYKTEIDAIEVYGAPNREVNEGGPIKWNCGEN